MLSLLLLLTIAWYSFRADSAFVIKKIEALAQQKWNAQLQLEGYQLQWTESFPLLQIQLRGIRLAAQHKGQYPVLQVSAVNSYIHPWELLSGKTSLHPIAFDSAWIHIYKDSLNHSNVSFSNKKKQPTTTTEQQPSTLGSLPDLQFNFLDFHYQDDHRNKRHHVILSDATVQSTKKKDRAWAIRLTGDSHFDGLLFKQKDGPFLHDTQGQLDLQLAASVNGNLLYLEPSSLKVKEDLFQLEGQFTRTDTNHMRLQIRNESALLKEVLPLLSDNIQFALRDIQIDQDLDATFVLDRQMIPGRKAAIRVDFETSAAHIQFKETDMTQATLSGYFSNDCDEDGIGNPLTSCVKLHQLDGAIFGIIPARIHGEISPLRHPKVAAAGQVEVELLKLNSLLAPNEKATFVGGNASVNFNYSGLLTDIIRAPFDERNVKLSGDAVFEKVQLDLQNQDEPFPPLSGQLSFNEERTLLEDMSLHWLGSNIRLTGRLSNLPEFIFYDDQSFKSDVLLHFEQLDLNQFVGTADEKENPDALSKSKTANPERIEKIIRRVAANINGQVHLQIDELRYDTLFATDVSSRIRFYSPYQARFQDSAMIQIDQLAAHFMGKTPIQAAIGISQDSVPNISADLLLPTIVPVADVWLPSSLRFVDGAASLGIAASLPLRALLQPRQLLTAVDYKGQLQFDQLEADIDQFTWPIKKLSGPLYFDSEQLHFDSLRFHYEGAPFLLNGTIDQYAFFKKDATQKAKADLQLIGNHLNLKPQKKTNQAANNDNSSTSPAQLFRSLDTVFHYATGKIHLHLDSISTAGETVKPLYAQAQLQPDEQGKYQLLLDSFQFGFGGKDRIKGSGRIFDWEAPKMESQLQAYLSLKQLGKLLPSEYIELRSGYMKMKMDYHSPLYDTLNAKNYLLKSSVKGDVELINGHIFYNYRDFTFNDIYGHFSFDEKDLVIRDLDLIINENRLFAHGRSDDFFPFFILPNRRANFELTVATPHFDFGNFTAPHGLGKDTLSADTSQIGIMNMGYIDRLLDKGSLDMTADFDKLTYEKFNATNITGRISLQPDTVQLDNLRMNVAKGAFKIDGAITNVVHHQPKMQIAFELTENDVSDIFEQFENFGQQHLGHENVEGYTSANISFQADINSNYSIIPETMYGDMRVKLAGAQLINLNALQKITGFLSKKRQLDHILVDTLETLSHIRGTDLYFKKFYLHSSSFGFGVEGMYSLGDDKQTRILFSVPLSNLFRRHLTREELDEADSERKGLKVHIEARHKKDQLRFRWKLPIFGRKKYRMQETD